MTKDENLILPGTAEIMIDYEKKVEEIHEKFPQCVVVRGFEELQNYLTEYRLAAHDLLEVFPWSYWTFWRTASNELPFIMLTNKVRKALPEVVETLSTHAQRANKLFSARDLAKYFRSHLKSSLQTVAVPVSLFVDDIEAFRRDFMTEKQSYLALSEAKRKRYPISNYWESIAKHLPANVHTHALAWSDDLEQLQKQQLKSSPDRVTLPDYFVNLPETVLPIFLKPKQVAQRNDCMAASTGLLMIRNRGWVKHGLETPNGIVYGYTPGPLLGQTKHWDDYRLGATVIMLASRAERLIGTTELRNAKHWNIPSDLIFRQWDRFKADAFQPMTDMQYLSSLKESPEMRS